METAQNATDPPMERAAATSSSVGDKHAQDLTTAVETPPPSPPPVPPIAAAPPLLYYAVWLPSPDGGQAGPPIYVPAAGQAPPGAAFLAAPRPVEAPANQATSAQSHNQRLLLITIILGVMVVHLPWIAYLVAVHGCWGTFLDACWQTPLTDTLLDETVDPFAETIGDPYLFARIVFLMLRVQAVLSSDWAEYSQAAQLSTGLGSFVLTRLVASNGLVAQGRDKAIYLAALCFALFLIMFWAELHLTSETVYPLLGDDTVLDYISQTLPPDFASYGSVRDGLMQLLQFLRLADALILGACLALPTTQRKPA